MNRSLFLSVHILFMGGAVAYLFLAPRNYVATAVVQTSYQIASPLAADKLTIPDDVQFGGTIARGFMDGRVLEEVVRKHPATGVTAASIRENCAVTPTRVNRTITLRLKSRRSDIACEIVLAIVDERLRLDCITQGEADQPAIRAVIARIGELRSQLTHEREALQRQVAKIGDPYESGLQWQQSTDSATMLDRTNIDLQNRILQARNRIAIVEAGITGSAPKLSGSNFAGYEFVGHTPKVQANFDSASDFPWLRPTDKAPMLNQANLRSRWHSYQLGNDHGIHREPESASSNLQGEIFQTRYNPADLDKDIAGHGVSDEDFGVSFPVNERRARGSSGGALVGADLAGAGIADGSISVLRDSTALAQAESKRGLEHASVFEATARLRQSRASSRAELVSQKGGIDANAGATSTAMHALAGIARGTEAQFQSIAAARSDPEYLERVITVDGLEMAYGEAVDRLRVLRARAKNSPPRFALIQRPIPAALPMIPGPLSAFVAFEIAALVLLWLVSPWTSRATP